jgi:two-component system chemotaxis sensor kinase CheA
MDVVKTNVSKLNGYVEVTTKKDIGTTFQISIPLTLAIIQALKVQTGGSHYAIPLSAVEEILKVSGTDITDVMGQKVLDIRGKVYPFLELLDILGNGKIRHTDYRYAVVVLIGEKKFCLAVDELIGLEEVFIKAIKGIDAVSSYTLGATIAGDGKVVLILDLAAISRNIFGTREIEHTGRTI